MARHINEEFYVGFVLIILGIVFLGLNIKFSLTIGGIFCIIVGGAFILADFASMLTKCYTQ